MGKKKKKLKEGEKKTKFSKFLTTEQVANYKRFGEPNYDQDWLEIFTEDMYSDIRTIMRSCSDNQLKADYILDELKDYGFECVGLGTNILTVANPYYPGVVFKIALDDYGVADNFNDCVLTDIIPRYNKVLARDPQALISIQERLVLPTKYQMDVLRPEIIHTLGLISRYFLIADLSPDMFLNYGITRDGDFRIIDGSDLYPLANMKHKPSCTRIVGEHKHTGEFKYCDGKLHYTEDFKWLICDKCGREHNPLELRPRKEMTAVSKMFLDGMTSEEIENMEAAELAAISHNAQLESLDLEESRYQRSEIFVHQDDEDEEEGMDQETEEAADEDLNDPNGPMVVICNTEDEDGDENEDEESEFDEESEAPDDQEFADNEGFMQLKPREVDLPEYEEEDGPVEEIASARKTAQSEVVAGGITGAEFTQDEFPGVGVDVTETDCQPMSSPKSFNESGSFDKESFIDTLHFDVSDPNVQNFMQLMTNLNNSHDDLEKSLYQGFLNLLNTVIDSVAEAAQKNSQAETREDEPDEEEISDKQCIEELQTTLTRAKQKIGELEAQLKNESEDSEELMTGYNELTDKYEAVTKDLEWKDQQLAAASKQIENLTNELQSYSQAASEKSEGIEELTTQIESLVTENHQLNADLNEARDLFTTTVTERDSYKLALETLAAEVEDLKNQPVVENDSTNKNNTRLVLQSDERTDPHINYYVINDNGDDEDADVEVGSTAPGIYLDIHGDIDEAYDNSGLPIYFTTGEGMWYQAVNASKIKEHMKNAIDDAKFDLAYANGETEA